TCIADGRGKLFASEIFVTNPRSNHRGIGDHQRTIDCVLFHRKKLDRTLAFAQRLLSSAESGVNQTKHAPRRPMIWLSLDGFLLLRPRNNKSGSCLVMIVYHTSDDAFYEWTIELNNIIAEVHFTQCNQRIFCSNGVTLAQSTEKPITSDTRHTRKICSPDRID